MQEPRVCLVAAMGRNRVIGRDGDLPWHLPADLKAFKAVTLGKPVIMGRKTFDSIGRPLPGRMNIVISKNSRLKLPGATVCAGLPAALAAAADYGAEEAMVIGGASIYEQALSFADELVLTIVQAEPDGDCWFPAYQATDWQITQREFRPRDDANAYDLEFLRLERSGRSG